MAMMVLCALFLAHPAAARGMCTEGMPCGDGCIPWDQPCVAVPKPGEREGGTHIPWELLSGTFARLAVFSGVYVGLYGIARKKSVGPREV